MSYSADDRITLIEAPPGNSGVQDSVWNEEVNAFIASLFSEAAVEQGGMDDQLNLAPKVLVMEQLINPISSSPLDFEILWNDGANSIDNTHRSRFTELDTLPAEGEEANISKHASCTGKKTKRYSI